MRGHWESGTRRLNRHYQSGGKGSPAPIWQWGKYLTGGSILPYRFDHDPDFESEYQDLSCYYNKPFSRVGDIYGTADYCKALAWEGPIAPRYDGIVKPGTCRDVSGTGSFERWYTEEILNKRRPKKDPDIPQSGFFTSSPYVHLHYDLGKRFVRFHCPKYGFGPGYNYAGSSLRPFYNLGQSEGPILTDIRIDAKACKMISGVYSRRQTIWIRHTTDDESDYSDYRIMYEYDNVEGYNIYDFEQIGQSYVHETQRLLWNIPDHTYRTVDIRVYTFIYNGELYLDLLPHFFDPDTGLEIPMSEWSGKWWVRSDSFPAELMGFCHMDPYIQPTTNFDIYPSPIDRWDTTYSGQRSYYYPPFTFDASDRYDQVVLLESVEQLPPDGVLGEDITFRALLGGSNLDNNGMRIFDVGESDFWLAESAWHSQHGGTPYLTGE